LGGGIWNDDKMWVPAGVGTWEVLFRPGVVGPGGFTSLFSFLFFLLDYWLCWLLPSFRLWRGWAEATCGVEGVGTTPEALSLLKGALRFSFGYL
jgi:hypothetical protein